MKPPPPEPAALNQPNPQQLTLSGSWTAMGLGAVTQRLEAVRVAPDTPAVADARRPILFGTYAVVQVANALANLIQQSRRPQGWKLR